MNNLKEENFEILMSVNGNKLAMTWKGQCGFKNADTIIADYLSNIVNDIQNGQELIIRFNDLEYFNSTSITPIIEFFSMLNSKGITTKVYYNKDSFYQKMSFKPMSAVVATLKNIELIGE